MSNEARHSKQTISDGIHSPVSFEFENETARLADTNFDEKDRNKFARDLDTNNLFILIDPTVPTWEQFNAQNGGGESNTASNVGSGQGIFRDKTGSTINLRSISGTNDISAIVNSDVIEISGSSLLDLAGSRSMTGTLNMGNQDISNVNNINGVSITSHVNRHADGGPDELNVNNLSGLLADPQSINLRVNGTLQGTRPEINLIEGANISVSAVDDAPNNRINITVTSTDTGESNTATNVGAGSGLFRDKTGVNLNFRSISGTNDISTSVNSDVVEVNGDLLLPRSGGRAMTGSLNMGNSDISNIKDLTFASEFNIGSVSGSLAVDWNNSSFQQVTLTGNVTSVTFTDPPGVARLQLRVIQGGTGNFNISGYPGNFLFGPNAQLPIFTAPTGSISIITFFFDGTSYYGILTENFG